MLLPSSGFFNSVNGDRLYDAKAFASYLKGIISNGVFNLDATNPVNTAFLVAANPESLGSGQSPSVIINSGKAYLDGLWAINDAVNLVYTFTQTPAQQITSGIQYLVYLCFDTSDGGRNVTIGHVTGTTPVLPTQGAAGKYYLPLAMVADHQSNQATVTTDLRAHAGVAAINVGTSELTDGSVTIGKLGASVVSGSKMVIPLADGLVTLAMLADDQIGLAKLQGPTILSNTLMTTPTSFKTEHEIGNGNTNRISFTAPANSTMKVDAVVVLDGSTAGVTRTVILRLKYRQGSGGAWVEIANVNQTVAASFHYTTVCFTGVFDMTAGLPYDVEVTGTSGEEYIDAYRMRMNAVVGPR